MLDKYRLIRYNGSMMKTLTIQIPSKKLERALSDYLDEMIYMNYDLVVIRRAGVPTRKALIDKIMATPKLKKLLVKAVFREINSFLTDGPFTDFLIDNNLAAVIGDTIKKCDKESEKYFNQVKKSMRGA